MKILFVRLFRGVIKLLDYLIIFIEKKPIKLVKKGGDRNLYKTFDNNYFWLNKKSYLDKSLIKNGFFEKRSVEVIHSLIKEGDFVFDVGANIGYYSVIMSKIVGDNGLVFSFEPTSNFSLVLKKNLDANSVSNVKVLEFGLSDKDKDVIIDIGPSSATMHSPDGYDLVISNEKIKLKKFDDFISENSINRVDFIKIDIDGHEPFFFDGAWKSLNKFSPIILCEISHLHYFKAGVFAWDFYRKIVSNGYMIYDENSMNVMDNEFKFLRWCANFDKTSNIILSKNKL